MYLRGMHRPSKGSKPKKPRAPLSKRPSLANRSHLTEVQKGLLQAITARQEERWREPLAEYRIEKHLAKGP